MADFDPRSTTGIPTEPVGSLPRPATLQEAYAKFDAGEIAQDDLETLQDAAVKDSIERGEATGAPVVSDAHGRQLPKLERGPFAHNQHAADSLGSRSRTRRSR